MSTPGSTHESESQYTLGQRLGREQTGAHDGTDQSSISSHIPIVPPEFHQEMPRCVSGHPPDAYCDLCRPDMPNGHRHHLPSQCPTPDSCEYCGKGTGSPCHSCLGCLEVLQRVYPPNIPTLEAEPPPRWEEVRQKVHDLWSEAVPPETAYHLSPKDEVGTFDIDRLDAAQQWEADGKPDFYVHGEPQFNAEEKGPGFEARLKNMESKLPISLLSPIFVEGIARVLGHGSEKYAANMWRDEPMPFCAELDSIFRHLFAFLRCEDFDPDSGELHLFNAACRLMFLSERYFTHPEMDDRYLAPGLDDETFQEEV